MVETVFKMVNKLLEIARTVFKMVRTLFRNGRDCVFNMVGTHLRDEGGCSLVG
jgi:hypothetical protein